MIKICTKCKVEKDRSKFYPRKNYDLLSWCKECCKESNKIRNALEEQIQSRHEKYKEKYDYHRDWDLKKRFGISLEDFNTLVKKQKNKCAICHQEFIDTPCVDHDHETGKVRGLLCRKHNMGLGLFGDSITLLKRALQYLKRSK